MAEVVKKKKIGLVSFTSNLFTFGLRSIESYLRKSGYDIFVIHCATIKDNPISLLNNFQLKILAEKCQDCNVVGISVISVHNLKRVQQVSSFLSKNTKAKIVLGGVPVMLEPHRFLKFTDFVCLGEGETFLKRFLETDNELEVPGLGYRSKDGRVILNELPQLIDLNELPIPRFDFKNTYTLFDRKFTSLEEDPEALHLSCNFGYRIFTIKGCSFSCTYCANNKLKDIYKDAGKNVRCIDTERVMKELEYAKTIIPGLSRVFFMSDDFTARSLDEFEKFIAEYQKRISLPFIFYSTFATFTEDKLKILLKYKANIIWMKLGLQSASERVNKQIYKRHFNRESFLDKIDLITSHNIDLKLDMILQNPYEKTSDWIENIDFFNQLGERLKQNKLAKRSILLNVYSLKFYPGTELYNTALTDETIKDDYVEKTLLTRSRYNYGRIYPYAPTMFSIDLLLLFFYYKLMAGKGRFVYRYMKNPKILGLLKKICSLEIMRLSYSFFKYATQMIPSQKFILKRFPR
ncbi:MAG: B12-binding domain-containing radical SAM protein [Candidatus Omnitrophica bacterium]|nr:B12-binding domain-containing radical SAM protein [Candidatus Omnitrophota bacterium]